MDTLTPLEESQFKATKDFIIQSVRPESIQVRTRYITSEVDRLVQNGNNVQKAERIIKSRCNQDLSENDLLQLDDGRNIAVKDILMSLGLYDGITMRDPLEPETGPCKAKFYANTDTGKPVIHSQLHGGLDYFFAVPQVAPEGNTSWFFSALAQGSVERFIDNPPPELDWVFKGSLLARTTGMLVGPGAAGKSTFSLMMLMAVATGCDILPGIFTPTRAGKVLGVLAEDDEDILHHRIHSMANPINKDAKERLRKNMRVVTTAGHDIRFLDASKKTLEESDFFKEVFEAIKDVDGLRLIVLDPVSRFHGAEENDNGAGTFLVSLLERIAQKTGAAVIIIHHVSKRAGLNKEGFDLEAAMHQDAARGASGLTNGVRWQCNLFGLPEKSAQHKLGVNDALSGQYLALKVSKKNYGKPEEVHFLERGQGGLLSTVKAAVKGNAPDLNDLIKELLFEAVFKAEGKYMTERMLLDACQSTWKEHDSRITRPAIKGAIANCILEEELFERSGKNASGKSIAYLSRYQEPPAKLPPENISENDIGTGGEPEAFDPEKPERTGESKPTVLNPLTLQGNLEPEKLNRKKEELRFVSPRFCETVEPEIFTPYGGDTSPSGSHRGDIPQPPLEDAEIF